MATPAPAWIWCVPPFAAADVERFARGIHEVFHAAFPTSQSWSLDSIEWSVLSCSLLALLVPSGSERSERIYGYQMYSVPTACLGGGRLLWGDSVAIVPEFQAQGFLSSRAQLDAAAAALGLARFQWLGCCTRSKVILRKLMQQGLTYPAHRSYDSNDGQTIVAFVRRHVAQVRARSTKLQRGSGIIRRMYAPAAAERSGAAARTFIQSVGGIQIDAVGGDGVLCMTALRA
jgi:hypothetical protein